jgi:hypothetical protein
MATPRKTSPSKPTGAASKATPAKGKGEDKPSRSTTDAMAVAPDVVAFLKKAGTKGATLTEISEATNLRGRVVHNVTWRLEGSPEVRDKEKFGTLRKPDERQIHRLSGTGRNVRYALGK